jgi:hypothetical protein
MKLSQATPSLVHDSWAKAALSAPSRPHIADIVTTVVDAHSVRSVFAVGGVVFGGAAVVFVFFGRDPIESRTARAFMPLVNQVKGILISRCSIARVFPPDSPVPRGGEP